MSGGLVREFWERLPRDVAGNVAWRKRVLADAARSKGLRGELLEACRVDPWFWVCGFVWTHDPREVGGTRLPFILYPYQVEYLGELFAGMGFGGGEQSGRHVEKSRDTGISWCTLVAFDWACRFREGMTFLVASRNEALVDGRRNKNALLPKLAFADRHLPEWMPACSSVHLIRDYPDTDSQIIGESTQCDIGRGGRMTAALLDEFAYVAEGHSVVPAIQKATNCPIWVSTPNGDGTAFEDLKRTTVRQLRYHWTDHPKHRRGLYTSSQGSLELLDNEYWGSGAGLARRRTYPFILDGRVRSVAYDTAWNEAISKRHMAREWDMDNYASADKFFPKDLLQRVMERDVREPLAVGDIEYSAVSGELTGFRADGRRLRLWCEVDADGVAVYRDGVVIACDPAAGSDGGAYSSESTAVVVSATTGEKLAEFATFGMEPHEFAMYVRAMTDMFPGRGGELPFVIWEGNGSGRSFGNRLWELRYRRVYFRVDETIKKRKTRKMGWWSSSGSKKALFEDYRSAMAAGFYVNRSGRAVQQCKEYEFRGEKLIHRGAQNSEEESSRGENHGDLVVADALAFLGIKELVCGGSGVLPWASDIEKRKESAAPSDPMVDTMNTLYGRRMAAQRKAREEEDMWR